MCDLEHRLQHYVTPSMKLLAQTLWIGDRFYPAIRIKDTTAMFYWPNIMYPNSEGALNRALTMLTETLADADAAARMALWNIWPA